MTITRPLAASVRFAEQVASGNLAHRLDIARGDEIGMLARALDTMRVKLGTMVAGIRESAELLVSFSQQINASARGLAEGAQGQAATLEQTSASMEELAASVDQVADHARSQASVAEMGTRSVLRVQESISEASGSFSRISQLAGDSVQDAVDGVNAVKEVMSGITLIAGSSREDRGNCHPHLRYRGPGEPPCPECGN